MSFRKTKELEERVATLEDKLEKIGRRIYELAQMEINASFQEVMDDFKFGALGSKTTATAKPFCWNHNHDLPCPYCKKKEEE